MTDDIQREVRTFISRPSGVSIGVLLICLVLGFGGGYYVKHKSVMAASKVIENQAQANKNLNEQLIDKMTQRDNQLNESLAKIGLSDDEIGFLYDGEDNKYNQLKKKFTEFLPGKTKWLKGDTVYIPRTDCSDDYLGNDQADAINQIIIRGRDDRQENQ